MRMPKDKSIDEARSGSWAQAHIPNWRGQRRLLLALSFVLLVVGGLTISIGVYGSFSGLQPWQPLIAALVALFAAGLAYQGAIAKVDFDRETAIADRSRKQLRILIRLEAALRHTVGVMGTQKVEDDDDVLLLKMNVTRPAEISEAWENIDLFDEPLAVLIGDLWKDLNQLHAAVFPLEDEIERRKFNRKGFYNIVDLFKSRLSKTANECLREVLRVRGRDSGDSVDAMTIIDPSAPSSQDP
jgi:hypothetical protein